MTDDVKTGVPTRYDISCDCFIPATQEWVNDVEKFLQAFGHARQAAKRAMDIQDEIVVTTHPALQEFLDAWKPEFEQKK